jgi:hypothetical protein
MNTISKHNINDQATVELTDEGLEYMIKATNVNFYHQKIKGKIYTSELWDIMATFGPYIYQGGPQLLKDNIILIKHDI